MKCPSCGSVNKKTAKFCNNCASPLAAAAPATPPAPPPAPAQPPAAAPAQPPVVPAATPPPAAPPPPGPLAGATPPPPRGPVPAGVWAGAGIGGLILVGILVWFFALRPDSGETAKPESSPIVETSPTPFPTTSPTTTPSPQASPTDDPGTALPTSYGTNLCAGIGENSECLDPFAFDNGWTVPATTPELHFHFFVEAPAEGAVISFEYIDKSTGQSLGESTWEPLTGVVPECCYVFYDDWILEEGTTWAVGGTTSMVIKYNGQPLSFGAPNDITFE